MSMVAIKIEPLIFWKQLALQITFVSIASQVTVKKREEQY